MCGWAYASVRACVRACVARKRLAVSCVVVSCLCLSTGRSGKIIIIGGFAVAFLGNGVRSTPSFCPPAYELESWRQLTFF